MLLGNVINTKISCASLFVDVVSDFCCCYPIHRIDMMSPGIW